MKNLSAPFIFQEQCRMKIEHVVFPSVFFKITDPCVGRSFSMCSHDPIVETNIFGTPCTTESRITRF